MLTVGHHLTARDALALCCRKDLGTIIGTDAMLLALTCSSVTQQCNACSTSKNFYGNSLNQSGRHA